MGKRWELKRSALDDALEGDDGDGDPSTHKFSVNQAYAKRFQHNKERDELQRLKTKYVEEGDSGESDDDSSEEEDEDADQVVDVEFASALAKIKNKDPEIYKAETKLFEDPSDESEDEPKDKRKPTKKAKPQYLKDVLAKQLLEDGPEGVSDDERAATRDTVRRTSSKSYHEEQEELRSAFLGAAADGDEEAEASDEDDDSDGGSGGGFMTKKVKSAAERAKEAEVDRDIAERRAQKEAEAGAQEVLSKYFGKVDQMNSNDQFLRDYIMNQGWIDKDERALEEAPGLIGEQEEEEEDFDDAQDNFEATYNFRFEEPGSERIVPHSRIQEQSIRKENTKRKRERESKKERMESEKQAKVEELKRLKALKRQELEKKLKLIKEVAGKTDLQIDQDALEADFDADEHDRKMVRDHQRMQIASRVEKISKMDAVDPLELQSAVFGEEYYAEEEVEDGKLVEKPQFGDLEEELAALSSKDKQGFQGATARLKKASKSKTVDSEDAADSLDDDSSDDDGENSNSEEENLQSDQKEDEQQGPRQRIGKRAAKRLRQEVQAHIDEYYKLDYEDIVGGMPTRFKYKEVVPKKFGTSVAEILDSTDKELNQIVSLKKIATYRDDRNDRKWYAPKKEDLADKADAKKIKHQAHKEKLAATKRKATMDHEDTLIDSEKKEQEHLAEQQAARLMSYQVPKVGKKHSVTAMPKPTKKSKKPKHSR